MKNKKIEKITKGAEAIILATDKGIMLEGTTAELMNIYVHITKELLTCKGVTKEKLDEVYNLAFMNNEELVKRVEKELNDLLEKLKKLGEKDE